MHFCIHVLYEFKPFAECNYILDKLVLDAELGSKGALRDDPSSNMAYIYLVRE